MGYRAELYIIEKDDLAAIRNLSKADFIKKYENTLNEYEDYPFRIDVLESIKGKKIHSLGDPSWDFKKFDLFLNNVFKDEAIEEIYNDDNELKIMNLDGFRFLIEIYRQKILEGYKRDLHTVDALLNKKNSIRFIIEDEHEFNMKKESLLSGLKSKVDEWEKNPPYDLTDKATVSSSWKYEYAIFELANIYKKIDWEKQYVIYTAG